MAPDRPPAVISVDQDETVTGEAVALDVQSLGFFLRGVGLLVDVVVSIALLLLLAALASWLIGAGVIGAEWVPPLAITVFALVTVAAPTTVETVTRGRSLGKLAVGGRVVRADGGSIGFRQAFLRALAGVLEIWLTLGAIAALVGVFTPRSQRLGDLLAGTYSERTRTRALPPPAPGVPPALAGWAQIADVARLPDRLAARIAQFVQNAPGMHASARDRLATALVTEALPFVSPVPPVDADTLLHAIAAVRRDREHAALVLQDQRVAALVSGVGRR